VSGESLIRNLLMGRQVAQRHGVEPMAVGYIPDTFGHVAQLPQILRGFGIDSFVFARGLDDRADEVGEVFAWQAPDGSQVTAIRQLGGYGNARQLGAWEVDQAGNRVDHRATPDRWPALAAERFGSFLDIFAGEVGRTPVDRLLLCNGDDHEPIWAPLPDLLEHVRGAYPGLEVSIDDYGEYVDAIRDQLDELPVVFGEMVAGRDAPILRGINSTRNYLKQANERTERELGVAETLAALAVLRGATRYPLDELHAAWRELLKNQPHDSVSGCSIDAVHRDMQQRYVTAGAIAERVRREALAELAGTGADWVFDVEPSAELSIVNPLPLQRRVVVELPLPAALADAKAVHLLLADGARLPVQLDSPGAERIARTVIDLPPFGVVGATLREGESTGLGAARAVDGRTIATEFLTVHAEGDGSLTVTDAHGTERRGLLVFEDSADRGDEYNFDALPSEVPWRSSGAETEAEVTVLSSGPLVAELQVTIRGRLPEELSAGRDARSPLLAELAITTIARLAAGIDRLELTTVVDNTLRDHRLRVCFPVAGAGDRVRAEGHFIVVDRPARMAWRGTGWREPPSPTAHTSGAVAAGDVAVFTVGLPEYEAIPTSDGLEVAITLLRCVRWLSRDDLVSRPGHAGPGIATPEAQCPGRHRFEYALRFGERSDLELVSASADYRHAAEIGPGGIPDGPLLDIAGEVAFSALKGAEDGKGVILRVFNPGEQPVEPPRLDHSQSLQRVRLDELEPSDGDSRVLPGQIATYRLVPKNG